VRIEESVLGRCWKFRVGPNQVACVVRLGKATRLKKSGLRFAVPGLEKVHLLSTRPHSTQAAISPVSSDGVRIEMVLSVHYRLNDGRRYLTSRPREGRPGLHVALLEARAGELVANYQPYNRILSERSALADDLKRSLEPRARAWGLHVDDITINWVKLPDVLPQSAAEREVARIEIDTKRARGLGDRETGMARLDVRERELSIIGAFAKEVSALGLGSSDVRDVLYLLLQGSASTTDLVGKKTEKKLEAEGISEGARAAAKVIEADPKFTFMLEELRNSTSRPMLDLRSPGFRGKSPAELDKLLAEALWSHEGGKDPD